MKNNSTKRLCRAGVIAALYVVLTYAFSSFAFGPFQVRPAEALCLLPLFLPEAIPALFVGCALSNILSAYSVYDIVFGSLATLIGAYVGSKMKNKWLVPVPTVVANTVIVPVVILVCYTATDAWSFGTYALTALGVFAGEVLSAYVLSMLLLLAMSKHKTFNSIKK